METIKLKVSRASDVTNEKLKSLILEIRKEDYTPIADIFCADDWQVNFYAEDKTLSLSWGNFLELFHQASVFVAQENFAMLEEANAAKNDPK